MMRHHVLELVRALVVGRVVHRRELEIGLNARLLQMLGRKVVRVGAGAGLHGGLILLRRFVLILGVDVLLDAFSLLDRLGHDPFGAPARFVSLISISTCFSVLT